MAKNDTEAVKWYRLAANQGLAEAQNNLGDMYRAGQGLTQDDAEAVKWYRLAADQGFAEAQDTRNVIKAALVAIILLLAAPVAAQDLEVGRDAYLRGDYVAALREFRPLAERGNVMAQISLGYMYDKGLGVAQDYTEAAKWYRMHSPTRSPALPGHS